MPGSVRGHRRMRAGPQRSGSGGRTHRAGRQALAYQQRVLQRTAAAIGRGTGHRLALRRTRVPVQLRRRGQRGRDQAGASLGRGERPRCVAPRHRHFPRQFPRPHPGGGHRDRATEIPGRLRAAAGRFPLRRFQRYRAASGGNGVRRCGSGDAGTGAGRGRGDAGRARLPARGARAVRSPRRLAGAGRNPVRHGPQRCLVRALAGRGRARYRDPGEGVGRRLSDRRDARGTESRRGHAVRRARHHLRRQSAGRGGRARGLAETRLG